MRTVGITLGDPCGIGPEIVLRALGSNRPQDTRFILYGSPAVLRSTAEHLDVPPFWTFPSSPFESSDSVIFHPSFGNSAEDLDRTKHENRARHVLRTLTAAAEDAQKGRIQALVTGPIDKSVVRIIDKNFSGHTDFLATRAGAPKTVMLFDNEEFRVALLTHHVALRDVFRHMTRENLESTLTVTARGLATWLGINNPHVALAGLNPHAGETVPDSEEEEIFRPVVRHFQEKGWNIEGPFPADTLFQRARRGTFDVIVSPYHDQALIAVKTLGFEKVVNITLGLPYLRVSPGHGVAYDLVGQKAADAGSFSRALAIASRRRSFS